MKFLILAVSFLLWFQTPAAKKDESAEKGPQKASLKAQVDILQVQKKETQLATQYNQCRTEMANIPDVFTKLENEKQGYVDAAFKESGLSKDDYDLNVETFEYTKKAPKPADPPKK